VSEESAQRARGSYGAIGLSVSPLNRVIGVEILKSTASGGPICYERAAARSFKLAQRIISGFVKAVDFDAVETLVPDL
jgi:hypothetical protein